MTDVYGNPQGEISSASYPARACGIKAGMMAKQAKLLCPTLQAAPYEFELYEQVSGKLCKLHRPRFSLKPIVQI